MIRSAQQDFLMSAIRRLGCVREDQLVALFGPEFCTERPDLTRQIATSALHRLRYCCGELRQTGSVYHLPQAKIDRRFLESVDVMLELSKDKPLDFRRGEPPSLLRFSVQEQKVRNFIVAENGALLPEEMLPPHTRIILLFDGQGPAKPLPVSNKQFFAVRQDNGTHRYFAGTAGKGGIDYAEKESSKNP